MALSIPAQLGDTAAHLADTAVDVASTFVGEASEVVGDVLHSTIELGTDAATAVATTAASAARGAGDVLAATAPPMWVALRRHPLLVTAVIVAIVMAFVVRGRRRARLHTEAAASTAPHDVHRAGTAAA